MIIRFGGILSISIALLGAALPHAQELETAPGARVRNANSFLFPDNASLGWSFTTNQAITVVALDDFDPSGGGNNNVRLYDGSGNVPGKRNGDDIRSDRGITVQLLHAVDRSGDSGC